MGKTLLGTSKVVISLLHKLVELHEAGIGQEIVDDIHEVIEHAKAVVDDHHDTHVE